MPSFFGSPWWPLWVFPLLTALILAFFWWFRGRDEHATLPRQHPFLPPLELSPAQVGTLIDESCDARDIVATLVDLAVRGYVCIEEVGERDFLLKVGDLRFRQGENALSLERLRRHERMFFEALFDSQPPDVERGKRSANWNANQDSWHETALSLLENKFYRHIPPIRAEIYASLVREGYFPEPPDARRLVFTTVGTFLIFGGLFVAGHTPPQAWQSGLVAIPLGIFISGLVWHFSAQFMAPKSALGTHNAEAARRFASWVRSVSHRELREFLARDAKRFERLFPYAVVLGVGGIWALKGGDCGQLPPSWFVVPDLKSEEADFSVPSAKDSLWRLGEHWRRIERVFVSAPNQEPRPEDESPTAFGA